VFKEMNKVSMIIASGILLVGSISTFLVVSEVDKNNRQAELGESIENIAKSYEKVNLADREVCRKIANLTQKETDQESLLDIAPWYQARIERNNQHRWVHTMVQIYLDKHIANLESYGSIGANNTSVQGLTKSYLELKNECSLMGVNFG
jgi:hypothetical protein